MNKRDYVILRNQMINVDGILEDETVEPIMQNEEWAF